jgi:hypothetical protein
MGKEEQSHGYGQKQGRVKRETRNVVVGVVVEGGRKGPACRTGERVGGSMRRV